MNCRGGREGERKGEREGKQGKRREEGRKGGREVVKLLSLHSKLTLDALLYDAGARIGMPHLPFDKSGTRGRGTSGLVLLVWLNFLLVPAVNLAVESSSQIMSTPQNMVPLRVAAPVGQRSSLKISQELGIPLPSP